MIITDECFTYGIPLDAIKQGEDGVFYVVVAGRGVVPLTSKDRVQLALSKLFDGEKHASSKIFDK